MAGLPVAGVWEGSPEGPGAHPWDLWVQDHSTVTSLIGRQQGQGPVGKYEKPIGVGGHMAPGRDWDQGPASPPCGASPEVTAIPPSAAFLPSSVPESRLSFLPSSLPQRKDNKQHFPMADASQSKTRGLEWSVTNSVKLMAMTAPEAKSRSTAEPSSPAWHRSQGPRSTRFR